VGTLPDRDTCALIGRFILDGIWIELVGITAVVLDVVSVFVSGLEEPSQ
jgi:hypothetical protein